VIVYHQRNVAAFAGNTVWYWPTQPLLGWQISKTTAAAASVLVSQSRSGFRFVFSRVYGRVN